MTKIIPAAGLIAVCLFSACANNEPDHDPSLVDSDAAKTTTVLNSDSQNIVKTDTAVMPLNNPAMVAPLPQAVVNAATATASAGMNPAHGQPNHRCDIAVGAPLNSPATKPAAVTTTTNTAPPVPSTAKTVTAPGMNPPHGEPNHRCDIAVGAPLNSPATKPAVQNVTPTPVVAPTKKDSGS